jgi:hypothetical protein
MGRKYLLNYKPIKTNRVMGTWNIPQEYPQVNMRYKDENGDTKFITNFKGFTMLKVLGMYSENEMIQARSRMYIDEDVDVERKQSMLFGEGGFLSAVLRGELLEALKRADECNYEALIKGLTNKEIEL